MRRRTVIGIILMVASISGLMYWELKGRDVLLLTPVLAAATDIRAGEVIRSSDLTTIRVLPENRIEQAMGPEQAESISGTVAAAAIARNQQIGPMHVHSRKASVRKDESIFVIPESWVASMSAAVRAGDTVRLVSCADGRSLGRYRVAYATDRAGRILHSPQPPNASPLQRHADDVLAEGLEIICTLESYLSIAGAWQEAGDRYLIVFVEEEA